MGWLYTNKIKSQSLSDFFSRFNGENESLKGTVLKVMSPNIRECYMAYETYNKFTQEKMIKAIVCLINYCPKDVLHNFGYKDMDESMGPFYYNCPKQILDMLTETTSENALKWREKCRETITKKQSLNKKWKQLKSIIKPNSIVYDNQIGFEWTVIKLSKSGKHLIASSSKGCYKLKPNMIDFEKTI